MSIANLCVLRGYSKEQGRFEVWLRKTLSWKGLPFEAQGKQGILGVGCACGKVWKNQNPHPLKNQRPKDAAPDPCLAVRGCHPPRRESRRSHPPSHYSVTRISVVFDAAVPSPISLGNVRRT